MQAQLLANALARREANSYRNVKTYAEMKEILDGPGGFIYAGWDGTAETEAKVKEETKATIRCLPDSEFIGDMKAETCLITGKPAKHIAVWSRSY